MTAAIECGYPHARSELTELGRCGPSDRDAMARGVCVRSLISGIGEAR